MPDLHIPDKVDVPAPGVSWKRTDTIDTEVIGYDTTDLVIYTGCDSCDILRKQYPLRIEPAKLIKVIRNNIVMQWNLYDRNFYPFPKTFKIKSPKAFSE